MLSHLMLTQVEINSGNYLIKILVALRAAKSQHENLFAHSLTKYIVM